MITKEHIDSFKRTFSYCHPSMLMLGRQTNTSGLQFPCPYKTLDPDGGDYPVDLNQDIPRMAAEHGFAGGLLGYFQTVFNIGTLEHVWDVHQAFVNTASLLKIDGYYIGQHPVAGWEGHGIHITEASKIVDFFTLNGFGVVDRWFTTAVGNPCDEPKRNGGKSILLWFVAQRLYDVDTWRKPQQVYVDGKKT